MIDRKAAILDRLGPSSISAAVLDLFPEYTPVGREQALVRCCYHAEQTPSLSVQLSTGLHNCKACGAKGDLFDLVMQVRGCDFKGALDYLESRAGIVTTTARPSNTTSKATGPNVKTRRVATFIYTDAEGRGLYQKERHEPARDGIRSKEFFFSSWDKRGNRQKGYKGEHVPYRLNEVAQAPPEEVVFFVEGEGKADLLASWGLVATCLDTGAESKWKAAYTPHFKGRHVVIIPDNDKPGEGYCATVAKALLEAAASVKVLRLPDLPEKGDVLDWIKTPGNDKVRFLELAGAAVPWEPSAPSVEVVQGRRKKSRDHNPSASPDELQGGRGAERLIPLLDDFPLYLDDSGCGFLFHNGRLYPLDSKNRELVEELSFLYWTITGKALTKDAAGATITYYSAKARRDGEALELFNRIGERSGGFYYDLMNGRVVELLPESWRIIPAPVMFRTFNHQQPQPDPLPGGDPWRLFDFVRVPEENRLLVLVAVITCFIPRINHPALAISGPQGSGKSFAQSVIKQIVDPSSMILSMMPRKVEELPLLLSRNHMTAIDNQSSFTGEIADLLCAAITGGVLEKRVLHTDSDMLAVKVPGVITYSAITSVSDRPDLHERTVRIVLDRIPPQERRTERVIWKEFSAALPSILGGAFDLIVKAMRIHPEVEDRLHELPRMADFATWGYAIAEALGGRGNEFLQAYTGNASMATADLLEHNTFFSAIVQGMERPEGVKPGTFAEVLFELRKIVDPEGEKNNFKSLDKDHSFPKAPQGFRGKLERLKIPLEDLGISYVIAENRTNKGRMLCNFFKRSDGPAPVQTAPVLDDLVFDDSEVF